MNDLPRRRPRGLTIIELVVVLIVLGVLVSLVGPSMRGMIQRQRVQGVQDQLVTDLQLARSEMSAAGGAAEVEVTFGGNADVTCYTIHTTGAGAACDCTRAPGQACVPAGVLREIKTTQVSRAQGVSLAASSPGGTVVKYSPPQGSVTPAAFRITVQGDAGAQLRTEVLGVGGLTVCSPGGSMRGVAPC